MTTTIFDKPRDRRLLGVHRQVLREREYEEANREARNKRSRENQRRRRAAQKQLSEAEQAAARERAASYQAVYREKKRWELLMAERRRRNTNNPDISKRKSRLQYPSQVDPVYRDIHKLWNDNIDAGRDKGCFEGSSGSVEDDGSGYSVEGGDNSTNEGASR